MKSLGEMETAMAYVTMFMDVVSVGEGSDEEIVTDASVFGAANDQTGREMGGGGGIGVATVMAEPKGHR
jgi:hypothetical protein